MLNKTLIIQNKLGLHARAANKFVKTVEAYNCKVTVSLNNMTSDGKSLMGLMSLGAMKGSEIHLSVEGDKAVLEALTSLINNKFEESE